jgi:hypothetical protein
MGYAPLISAFFCLLVTTFLAVGGLWLAYESRRVRFEEREARRRVGALERAHEPPPSPSDMAVVVRFERAGEATMRRVLERFGPEGKLPVTELRKAVDPMVDSLRLATHADAFAPGDAVPPLRRPTEGGLLACLRIRSRAPLPGLVDPTAREGLAAWLRKLEALEPTKLLSVKLVEIFAAADAPGAELRPLHR